MSFFLRNVLQGTALTKAETAVRQAAAALQVDHLLKRGNPFHDNAGLFTSKGGTGKAPSKEKMAQVHATEQGKKKPAPKKAGQQHKDGLVGAVARALAAKAGVHHSAVHGAVKHVYEANPGYSSKSKALTVFHDLKNGKHGVAPEVTAHLKTVKGKVDESETFKAIHAAIQAHEHDGEAPKAAPKAKEPEKAKEAPAPAPKPAGPPDATNWPKLSGKKGSNPGGTYEAPDGSKHYVKEAASKAHLDNELLAADLYKKLGVKTLEPQAYSLDGKHAIGTKIQDLGKFDPNSANHVNGAKPDFAAHAFLGNWDAAGATHDNLAIIGGKVAQVDGGGSMKFRAQGEAKGAAFGKDVKEWESLRDKGTNPQMHAVFGDMAPAQLKASAAKVSALTDKDIDEAVDKHISDPKERESYKEILKARRDDITKKAAALDTPKPAPEPAAKPAPAPDPVHEPAKPAANGLTPAKDAAVGYHTGIDGKLYYKGTAGHFYPVNTSGPSAGYTTGNSPVEDFTSVKHHGDLKGPAALASHDDHLDKAKPSAAAPAAEAAPLKQGYHSGTDGELYYHSSTGKTYAVDADTGQIDHGMQVKDVVSAKHHQSAAFASAAATAHAEHVSNAVPAAPVIPAQAATPKPHANGYHSGADGKLYYVDDTGKGYPVDENGAFGKAVPSFESTKHHTGALWTANAKKLHEEHLASGGQAAAAAVAAVTPKAPEKGYHTGADGNLYFVHADGEISSGGKEGKTWGGAVASTFTSAKHHGDLSSWQHLEAAKLHNAHLAGTTPAAPAPTPAPEPTPASPAAPKALAHGYHTGADGKLYHVGNYGTIELTKTGKTKSFNVKGFESAKHHDGVGGKIPAAAAHNAFLDDVKATKGKKTIAQALAIVAAKVAGSTPGVSATPAATAVHKPVQHINDTLPDIEKHLTPGGKPIEHPNGKVYWKDHGGTTYSKEGHEAGDLQAVNPAGNKKAKYAGGAVMHFVNGSKLYDPSGASKPVYNSTPVGGAATSAAGVTASAPTTPKTLPVEATNTHSEDAHFKQTAKAIAAGRTLSSKELSSLQDYQGSGYKAMNGALRRGKEIDVSLFKRLQPLNKAIEDHTTKENMNVFRGIGSTEEVFGSKNITVGSAVLDNGYMSTSTDTHFSRNWAVGRSSQANRDAGDHPLLLEFNLPAGSKALPLNHHSGSLLSEKELLLGRGTLLTVKAVRQEKHKGVIVNIATMEYV